MTYFRICVHTNIAASRGICITAEETGLRMKRAIAEKQDTSVQNMLALCSCLETSTQTISTKIIARPWPLLECIT
jgi:hypothetical protein